MSFCSASRSATPTMPRRRMHAEPHGLPSRRTWRSSLTRSRRIRCVILPGSGMTMTSRVLFVVCAGLLALAPRSLAQPADALKKAQAAFDQAQLDYVQGKYDEAAQ